MRPLFLRVFKRVLVKVDAGKLLHDGDYVALIPAMDG
jgi:molybdopterin converting factor small subunit